MKKDGIFTGWNKVFAFTFGETVKKKNFVLTTVLIGIIFAIIIIGIFVAISLGQVEEDKKPLAIKDIYVVNDSGLDYIELQNIEEVIFHKSTDSIENLQQKIYTSQTDALLHIEKGQNENILINLILPSDADVSENQGYAFLDKVTENIQTLKLKNIGIEQSKLSILLSPITTSYMVQGDEPESVGVVVMKMVVPLLSVMLLYMMTLFYGQSIGKIVSAEKTSKLIETLLLSVRPYALILGKIFAMIAVGVLQFLTWMLGIGIGVFVGDIVGTVINKKFSNPLYEAFDMLGKNGASEAITIPSVVLAIIAFFLGFSFFLVVAGFVASRISKAEDLAQGMGLYQLIVIASFFVSYYQILNVSKTFAGALRIIPFTSAYCLTSEILLGEVGIIFGFVLVTLLAGFTFIAVILAAKFYKNQIFY